MQVAIVHEGNFELYKRLPTGTFLQGSATTTMHFTLHSKDTIMVVAVAQTKSKDYIVKADVLIGGWGCDTVVRQHPNREIDFDCACVCVACVRAKLCARDDSAVARGGRMEFVRWSVRPSVRLPRSRGVFFAFGLGLCEDVQLSLTSVSVFRSR